AALRAGPQLLETVAGRAGLADRGGRGGDGGGGSVLVEQDDRHVAVGQRLGDDVQPAGRGDLLPGPAETVLVHGDDVAVGQDGQRGRAGGDQVAARDERGGHLGPQAELGPVLGGGHAPA